MTRSLTTLSLSVSAGMLILGIAVLLDLRTEAWRQSIQSSDNLVLALSRDIARNITSYDLSLQGAIKALNEPGLSRSDPTISRMALFDTSATAEYLGAILVANAQGDIIADSTSLVPQPLNLAFRDHFLVHKRRPDVGLYISRPFDGHLVRDSIIALTRRITNPDGSFGGIVEGAMRLTYFRDLFDKLDIGAKGSVTLFRNDGRMITRRPFRQQDVDGDVSDTLAFKAYLQAPHGHLVSTAKTDGVRRLYTFHHIDGLPLILSIGLAVDEIYAGWWHKAIVTGALLITLCATSMMLCLMFHREILRRTAAEASMVAAAKRLSLMASTDGLTGIANRRSFEEALAREWRRSVRSETFIAAILLDVDCFKLFNDHYGHQAGDDALKAVAACIARSTRRPADVAARYGGEEFVAMLPETEAGGAITVAETVRAAVAELMIPHAASPIGHVTVSVGVAVKRPALGDTPASLIKEADEALYEAKRRGRNRVLASMTTQTLHALSAATSPA